MKKLFAIALTAVLAATCTTGLAVAASAATTAPISETASVYLMPGSWQSGGEKTWNTVSGAIALSESEKTALNLEGNVYKAGETGSQLPAATTTQEGHTFNGWWYIVDATVTHTDVVPKVTETTYLYADFRAALSQWKDPVAPKGGEEQAYKHYMHIIHEDGTEEDIELFISGTDVANIETAGYAGPVQFYNEWFELKPGDLMQVWVTGIISKDKPTNMPYTNGPICNVSFESGGRSTTSDYITEHNEGSNHFVGVENPTLRYLGEQSHNFRVYIKFANKGARMNFYMEKMD